MENLHALEIWVNATENYICGDSDIYETFTNDIGVLFRAFQREHGKCISKQYIDLKDGETRQIGWVFQKKRYYEDTKEPYIAETWISVHTKQDTISRQSHYYNFN